MKAQDTNENTRCPICGGTVAASQAQPASLNAQKHGAFGYLARTAKGEPIPMTLALVESQVIADIERDGPRERIRKLAYRAASVGEMLYGRMLIGEKEFDSSLKHWGWIMGQEARLWLQHETMRNDEPTNAATVLESIKRER